MPKVMQNVEFIRSGSRTAATSKMELFVIIVNGWKPLTIITKCSILDVAAVLDPPLFMMRLWRALREISKNVNFDVELSNRVDLMILFI